MGHTAHPRNLIHISEDMIRYIIKLAQRFRGRRFLKFVNVFSLFCIYLPLEKGGDLHLNNLTSLTRECFVPSLVEIDPVVLEKKMKLLKVYNNNDNDDGQWINFDQKIRLR